MSLSLRLFLSKRLQTKMPAIEAEVSAADGDVQWGATHEPDASIPSERAVSTSGWGSEDTGV